MFVSYKLGTLACSKIAHAEGSILGYYYYTPPLGGGGGIKSRTKRPRKTKIGTEVAHVTRHTFLDSHLTY